MNESKGTMESVTLSRVPDEQRKNWWTVALIQAGIMISIPCLMVGSTLASSLSIGEAIIAIIVGFAIAVFFMTLIGMQSSDLGRPMCVVASSAFGKTGVRIFMMILFSAALICWFGYQMWRSLFKSSQQILWCSFQRNSINYHLGHHYVGYSSMGNQRAGMVE